MCLSFDTSPQLFEYILSLQYYSVTNGRLRQSSFT